jgi:NAD+ kinase
LAAFFDIGLQGSITHSSQDEVSIISFHRLSYELKIIPISIVKAIEISEHRQDAFHDANKEQTMPTPFTKIGIIGRLRHLELTETLLHLVHCLQKEKVDFYIEADTAQLLGNHALPTIPKEDLATRCDLVIVIGGDGSLLQAAHLVIDQDVPLLGINKGRLGFLTDVSPEMIEKKIPEILAGAYHQECRFLLTASVTHNNVTVYQENALNEVVLLPGAVAHMIEFAIHVNEQFVWQQRADGLIVATPTGSTAYALSGGGPILHPDLDAIVLVPMFPHTLSSRPLVIKHDYRIRISFPTKNDSTPSFSCDGQTRHELGDQDQLSIHKKEKQLKLVHPLDYNYFHTLRTKLNWEVPLIRQRI